MAIFLERPLTFATPRRAMRSLRGKEARLAATLPNGGNAFAEGRANEDTEGKGYGLSGRGPCAQHKGKPWPHPIILTSTISWRE